MAIQRRPTTKSLFNLRDEMRRTIDDFFPEFWGTRSALSTEWSPTVDVSETEKEIVVEAELPGLRKEDIEVSLENSTLSIRGERKREEEKKEDQYISTERFYGSFYRSVDLPTYVDDKNVKANYKDGILEIRMPKKEEAKPKKIEIGIK